MTMGEPKPGWYVIQVRSSTEDGMCRRIEKACAVHDENAEGAASRVGLSECFSPRFRTQRKWEGEWRDVEHLLLPGYVIADVRNPVQLAEAIRKIRDLCRLLSNGETYEPLNKGEREWIEGQTKKGDRVVPMSFARKVNPGDSIEITEGPLSGFLGKVVKIDRANSLAHIELHVGQMTIKTKVGLAVMPS